MGPSPTYHPPEGEECETSVEHGLPLWAEPAVGYCSRRPRPSPMWGSRFVGARVVRPWLGEQKPLGKTPLGGNPSPEMTYLPTLRVADCASEISLTAHRIGTNLAKSAKYDCSDGKIATAAVSAIVRQLSFGIW